MSQPDQSGADEKREVLREAPASETDARAAALLPMVGTEDARGIRGSIALPEPNTANRSAELSYLPEESTEWVVDVRFSTPTIISRSAILTQFGTPWRKLNGSPTIYGRDALSGRWTYVLAGGAPESFTELKFGWPYFASWSEEKPVDAGTFSCRIHSITEEARQLGKPVLGANKTAHEAVEQAERLRSIYNRFATNSVIVLQAPPRAKFAGREVWGTMLSLGLRWGDMDLFHWDNPSEWGDDHFFSVWTSTQPGYFLPERIATGETKVEDLVFGFSVPRCYRPGDVAEAMVRSADYCRSRLGGVLLDENGKTFEAQRFHRAVQGVVSDLHTEGFTPGTTPALHLF